MRWTLGSATPSSFAQGQHMTVRSSTTILEDIPSPIPSDLVIRPRTVVGPLSNPRDRLPIFGERTEAVRATLAQMFSCYNGWNTVALMCQNLNSVPIPFTTWNLNSTSNDGQTTRHQTTTNDTQPFTW
jgi:hypothetical protein